MQVYDFQIHGEKE
uniref:Uncharacterized protein n=1 Tax=Anguilla anguilla TaxID=7936 RepID=A0A0E9RPL4_ANGAN